MNYFTVFVIAVVSCCENRIWDPRQLHVAALILARGGSKSIPLKNIARIHGRPLLKIALDVVTRVDFSSVWVSTDHIAILEEAGDVNVHWRSEESASDDAPSVLGVLEFARAHPEVDVIALVQCTSPLLKTEYLQRALELVGGGVECVFSVTRSFKLRWAEVDGELFPLNFNLNRRPRRQSWRGELVENGMFYFASRRLVLRGNLQNHRSVSPTV